MSKTAYQIKKSTEVIKIVTYSDEYKEHGKAIIRISENAYDKLSKISRHTGVPIGKIASACVDFCIDNDKLLILEDIDE